MSAIRKLLSNIIDYAGLFPPTLLSLPQTLGTFRRHLQEPTGWMVGKIVLPSNTLQAIDRRVLEQFEYLPVTIIPNRTTSRAQWLEILRDDVLRVKSFAENYPQLAVETFELLLPENLDSAVALSDLLKSTSSVLEGYSAFFEIPSGSRFDYRFAVAGSCLREAGNPAWGLKLRTGGTKREQFPSSRTVAGAILVSQHTRVPIKFTAGLHHPVRRWDENLQTEMHGFVNVFLGAILARTQELPAEGLIQVLEEMQPARFWFRESAAGWSDLEVPTAAIERLRRSIVGFGSCSIDEPREDLEALGWLPLVQANQ